ncbi:MAG: MFS transporter [Candidatus Thorarchaeota archaeon]
MDDSYQPTATHTSPQANIDIGPSKLQSRRFLFTLITATGIGVFMGALDGSIVNVSLEPMAEAFQVSQSAIQWVILSYLIIMASFTAIAGKIGDKYSNKLIFQIGMLIFTIGSFLSSISPNLGVLLVSRIIQAIGATGLTANGIAIITRFTNSKNRGTAIGWNSIFVASALTVGPVLGGILTYRFGWASIFVLNIPIGIIGLLWVQKAIPPTPPRDTGKHIDITGAILFGSALILQIGGVSIVNSQNFISSVIIAIIAIIVGLIILVIFYFLSKRKSDPVIDITLFNDKTFVVGVATALLVYGVMEMIIFQLPFLVIYIYNFSVEEAGFVLLGIPLAMALVGPIAGRLSDKYDPKYITTFATMGLILTMIGFIVTTSDNFNWFVTIPLTFCLGAAVAFFSSPNGNSIMSAVPKNRLGVAGGFIGIARTFGFSAGLAISTMVMVLVQPIFMDMYGGGTYSAVNYIPTYQIMVFIGVLLAILSLFITYQRPKMVRL